MLQRQARPQGPVRHWQQQHPLKAGTCRRPRRGPCRSTGAGPQQQQQQHHEDAARVFEQLVQWVVAQGGYIHPSIALADPAPCGTRGLITTSPLSPGAAPLLEIPLTSRLTSPVALEVLQPALSAAGMPTAGGLAEEEQLALALAYLRAQGAASPWHPYIASLPEANPCGWSKDGGQLKVDFDRCLHRHGVDLQWWQFFVGQATAQVDSQLSPLAARFGPALGVTRDDLCWALGVVQSRRVTIDGEMVLEPVADLLNFVPVASPVASPAVTSDAAVTSSTTAAGTAAEAATASSSGMEHARTAAGIISWSYGVNRSRELVVSRGLLTGQRVVLTRAQPQQQQQQQAASTANITNSSSSGDSTPSSTAAESEKPVLPPGSELCVPQDPSWSTQSNTPGDAGEGDAHLRPLAFYLQYGFVHGALAGGSLSRRHLLNPWAPHSSSNNASTSSNSSSNSSSSTPRVVANGTTPLFDYLTEQYQCDVVEVLEAVQSKEGRQPLLDWVLQPVNPPAGARGSTAPEQVSAVLEPVLQAAVQRLDELILEAIDGLEEEEEEEAGVEAAA